MKVASRKKRVSPPKTSTKTAVMSGTAGSRRVETNETARATATAAIKTMVAVKSPAFGPLRIGGGRKGATAGSKSFGRAFAKKNRINGPISTPNLSHGDSSFPRFAFGTAAPACISFIQFGLYGSCAARGDAQILNWIHPLGSP